MSGFPHPPSSHVPLASVSSAPELDGWLCKVNLGGSELGVMFALCLLQCLPLPPQTNYLKYFFLPQNSVLQPTHLTGFSSLVCVLNFPLLSLGPVQGVYGVRVRVVIF